jgi:hypothetical protein
MSMSLESASLLVIGVNRIRLGYLPPLEGKMKALSDTKSSSEGQDHENR